MSRNITLAIGAAAVVVAGSVAVASAAPHHSHRAARPAAHLAGLPSNVATYKAFDSPALRQAAASSADVQRLTSIPGQSDFVGQVVGLPNHVVAARHADGRICAADAALMGGTCGPGTLDKPAISGGCDVCDGVTLTWSGVVPDQVTRISDDAGHTTTPTSNSFRLAGVPRTSALTLTTMAGTVTIPGPGPMPPLTP